MSVHGPVCSSACKFEALPHPTETLFQCKESMRVHACGDACAHTIVTGKRTMCALTFNKIRVSEARGGEACAVPGFRQKAQRNFRAREAGARRAGKRARAAQGPVDLECGSGTEGGSCAPVGMDAGASLEAALHASTPVVCEEETHQEQGRGGGSSKAVLEVIGLMREFLRPKVRKAIQEKGASGAKEKAAADLRMAINRKCVGAKGMPAALPAPVEDNIVFYVLLYNQRRERYLRERSVGPRPPSRAQLNTIAHMVVYNWMQYEALLNRQQGFYPGVGGGSYVGTLQKLNLRDFSIGLLLCLKQGVKGDHDVEVCAPNPALDFVPAPLHMAKFRNGPPKMIPVLNSVELFLKLCEHARTTF